MNQTLGESRVRVKFNPSEKDVVDIIKQRSANLINVCVSLKTDEIVAVPDETPEQFKERTSEKFRLIALAQTAYEEAAMWAVKAATI